MRTIKAVIEYDGTRYSGSSNKKRKAASIESKMEAVLVRQLDEEIGLVFAVPTEAGVHAQNQVLHFKTDSPVACSKLQDSMNEYLPKDIRVVAVKEEQERFHAAFQKEKVTYEYHINLGDTTDVFASSYQYKLEESLDLETMYEAATLLTKKHDLTAFVSNKKMKKSPLRTVEEITFTRQEDLLLIAVTIDDVWPDLMLYLIGVLLAIGEGRLSLEELMIHMENHEQGSLCIRKADPKGLILQKVYYGETDV